MEALSGEMRGGGMFELAAMQLAREGKAEQENAGVLLVDYAVKIRRYFDRKEQGRKKRLV